MFERHKCVAVGKEMFSTPEGDCWRCRTAKKQFEDILERVGGRDGFAEFVASMKEVKTAGKHGRALGNRATRIILTAIESSGNYSDILRVYTKFLAEYNIGLVVHPTTGLAHHDYTGLKAAVPQLVLQWEKGGEVGQQTLATGAKASFRMWRLRIDELIRRGKASGYHVTAKIV